MSARQTESCQPFIDGIAISEEVFVRHELERARAALALMKAKLGPQGMLDLLAREREEMEQEERETVRGSAGGWTPALAELQVKGLKAQEFLEWFYARARAGDHAAMLAAHPEHYLISQTADGRLDVIETTGEWRHPSRFFAKLGVAPQEAAPNLADIDPSYPHSMAGVFTLADGLEMGRVLHQFANTDEGFKAKLIIYFPAGSEAEKIQGHKWHLAIEFTNWVNLCLKEKGQRR